MNNSIDNNTSGFELISKEFVDEINSEALTYTHKKTKAKLIFLSNDDNEKVFIIGFRTPPTDDTGVAHIVEHSVFCGSEKFPVKEPFLEIMKGSLNTFLNAMTYKDKTIYPFATLNEEDFMNILNIYLDAVFNPKLDKIKEIFMQEGWHYELERSDDDLNINGVVYNEMRGSLSSPTTLLINEIYRNLFDNLYKYVSGGDPSYIPELTYENFVEFYHKHYHPSNSCIYVYGNCNIDEILDFINTNYLSKYEYNSEIPQYTTEIKNINNKYISAPYPIDENDSDKNKCFVAKSYVISDALDDETSLAIQIASDILINSDAAPIKRALLKKHLCANVYTIYDNSILQPVLTMVIENTDKTKLDEIDKTINDTLMELVENGIDKKLIEACVNIHEFNLRESSSTGISKGLSKGISIVTRWAYCSDNDNILDAIKYESNLDKIKQWINTCGFEEIIKKHIINNKYNITVTLYPEKGLGSKNEKQLNEKLKSLKESMNSSDIENIINSKKALTNRQNTPDTEEQLNTIPLLDIDDINPKANVPIVNELIVNGCKTLYHECNTNDIIYFNLMFDTSELSYEELTYLGLLCNTLGSIGTNSYTFEELSNEILINTGGIIFNANGFSDTQSRNKTYKFMEVTIKALKDNFSKAIDLLIEILFNTKFNDHQRLLEIIKNILSEFQTRVISSGHQLALTRLGSQYSDALNYKEKTSSFTFFKNIEEISEYYHLSSDAVSIKLRDISKKILTHNNLTVTAACSIEDKEILIEGIKKFTTILPKSKKISTYNNFSKISIREGFMTPSSVQYIAQGYNFKELGFNYDGHMEVLKTILSTDYLWNNIRVKGGAYGAMVVISPSGNLAFVSYRDPNLKNTLNIYSGLSDFIKNFDANEREMTKFILGTVQSLDQPLFPLQALRTAVVNHITHNTPEFSQKIRDQILGTTSDDIQERYEILKEVIDKNLYVVFGNSEIIKTNKEIFDNTVNTL